LTRVLGDRSIVGAIDAINDRAHAGSAVAMTPVRALKLPIRAWLEALEDSFELVQIILGNMARNGHALRTQLPSLAAQDEPESIARDEPIPSYPMNLVEKILALRKADPFRRAALQATTTLANLAEEVRLDLGDALFRKGQLQRHLCVVAAGAVRATHRATGLRQTTNAGFVINSAATFASALDEYEIVATKPSIVLEVSLDDVFDVMEEHFEFVRSTMMMLSTDFEKDLIAAGGHNPAGRDVS
jgi:CRP-like cAMP-binding protein